MVGEKNPRNAPGKAARMATSLSSESKAASLLHLETAQDREQALRAVGGNGSRWLDSDKLSVLFAKMQTGFDKQAAKSKQGHTTKTASEQPSRLSEKPQNPNREGR